MLRNINTNALYGIAIGLFLLGIVFTALIPKNVSASEKASLEALIAKADIIKSTDPSQFFKLIADIKLSSADLNAEQLDMLKYFESYGDAYNGEFAKAIKGFNDLLNNSNSQIIKFRAKISLVNIYGIIRNYTEGFAVLQSLVQELPEIEDSEIKQQGLIIAAFNFNSYQKYELALEYAEKLLARKPEKRNLCFGRQLKIEAEYYLKPTSYSAAELNDAIAYCTAVGEPIAAVALHVIKARLLIEANKVEEAAKYLLQYEDLVKKTDYPRALSEYYIVYARAKWLLQETDDAELYANKALDISEGEEYVKPKVFAYSLLHEIAKAKGDFKLALDHYVNYSEADKAQINEILAQQLAYNIVEHQTEEKIQEIKLLNKQNEVLKLEQDLSKEEASNNRLMVILLIFILTSLAFWTYRVKRNQIKLKRQSETDLLTGVSSRQHFYFMCRKTLEHAKKTNQEVTFVLFDMDGFKSVNDNYGHLVGDWVLKKAVSVCIPCWRQNDIAGRLGGEEFALMLPTCNMERAKEIAEQCRKAIEAVDTSDSGHKFPLSASFGITTTRFSGYEFSQVIGDADKTMYQAKAAGKNQVCCVEISDD